MEKIAVVVVVVLMVVSCGGGAGESVNPSGPTAPDGSGGEQSPGDGTRLLVAVPGGIDVVDLDNETQQPFISDLGQVGNLRLLSGSLWFVDGTDLVSADPVSGQLKGRVPVPAGVVDLTVDGNTAWVLTGIPGASKEVVVIDTGAMTQLGSIPAPESTTYLHIAAVGGDAWVFGGDPESAMAASKLDSSALKQSTVAETGIIADSMAPGIGGIWIGGTIPAFVSQSGNPESGIVQIAAGTGDVIFTVELGEPADHIFVAVGFDHVWVTKGLDGSLYKIDAATGEIVNSVDTGDGAAGIPLEIIIARDLVWVFNRTNGTVTGYNPETLEFAEGINVPPFVQAPVFAS